MKKNYEDRQRFYLQRRAPVILRVDGRAFHTLSKDCEKPFDPHLRFAVLTAADALLKEIQGAKFAYHQSDEISIFITDYDELTTEAWFDYNIAKMCSNAAALASITFSRHWRKPALFDCRVFNIPKEEVINYFVWRQRDWERNSLSMFARSYFSHKELHGKNKSQMHEMLHEKNANWADLDDHWKNGTIIDHNRIYSSLIFSKSRSLIEKFIYPENNK